MNNINLPCQKVCKNHKTISSNPFNKLTLTSRDDMNCYLGPKLISRLTSVPRMLIQSSSWPIKICVWLTWIDLVLIMHLNWVIITAETFSCPGSSGCFFQPVVTEQRRSHSSFSIHFDLKLRNSGAPRLFDPGGALTYAGVAWSTHTCTCYR